MIENPSTLAEHVSNLAECVAEDIKKLQSDTSKAVYTVNNNTPVDGNVDIDVPPGIHVGDVTPEDESIVWIDPTSSKVKLLQTVNSAAADGEGNIVIDCVESATKTEQDGEGNEITETYVKKSFVGDQLIDYLAIYDSIMNTVISAGGRKLYRHSSNMGTVMEFNDGQPRKVMILDAKYRASSLMMTSATYVDTSLPNYDYTNVNDNWYVGGSKEKSTPATCSDITDEELNTLWASSIDVNTAKFNTDVWLTQPDCQCATHCRSVKVDGVGCDIPNFQTLIRIYCDGIVLDSMDPTLKEYPDFNLTNFNFANYVYSSTEGEARYVRQIDFVGYCSARFKDFYRGVIPVLEL